MSPDTPLAKAGFEVVIIYKYFLEKIIKQSTRNGIPTHWYHFAQLGSLLHLIFHGDVFSDIDDFLGIGLPYVPMIYGNLEKQ